MKSTVTWQELRGPLQLADVPLEPFSRSRSTVVSPPRFPEWRSAWRSHFRSVSGVQPIFSAIQQIAAHWDS